jgi:hypothetical protein
MKPFKLSFLGAAALLFSSAFQSFAITNTAIAISGHNVVLSWPSYGYEIYLIQYCPSLGTSNSWSTLTNAFPANSTNRTTFTMGGLVSQIQESGDGGSDDTNYDNPRPPGPGDYTSSSTTAAAGTPSVPMAMPADGSGSATPLAIYPPGFDLSGFVIFDPATGEWTSGNGYVVNSMSSASGLDAVAPLDATENIGGTMSAGFYRVFHIPNWLVDITNYVFDGPTFIPVDYAAPDAPPDHVDSTTVLINGQPTDYAQFMPYVDNSGVTNWGVGIYFDRLPNGTDTIQLITTVRQSDALNDQTPYMVFSNAPATIAIGNLITFTNWDDLIWNSTNYTFRAKSSVANVDWEIDIYDVYGDFVNYQTGHSSDGNISWTWNLYDYWGDLRNNSDADPVFYSTTTLTGNFGNYGSSQIHPDTSSVTLNNPSAAAPYPSVGAWLFAYMDNFYSDAGDPGDDTYYKAIMNGLAAGPEVPWNIPATTYPLKYGTNYAQADRDSSWDGLRQLLANSQYRNFYYNGHGSMDSIGGDITGGSFPNTYAIKLPNSRAELKSADVRDNVTFHNTLGVCFYRFVWLDGCATEFGNWPDTWGIGKRTNDLAYYSSPANTYHMRPSAFVGWHETIGGNGWGTANGYIGFRSSWMGNWSVNNGNNQDGLSDIFTYTANYSPNNWPPGKSTQLWGSLRVYGYRNIKFNEYNRKGDWSQ